ncbi:hypothetical protein HMI55_002637 [Coelomomyces lativittatus]|nr:hypothetical protein HMI55_002637 [Coelomomyces lativittatus]
MLNSLPTTTTTPPTPSLVTSVSTPSHYLETIHRFRTLCFSLPSLVSQRDLSKIQWTSTQLKECLTILKKSPIHQETGSSKESSTTTHTSSSSSTTSTSFPLPSSTLASTSTTPPRPSSLPNSTTPFHLQILSSTLCEVTLHNSVLVRIHHEGSRGPWITEIEVTLVGGGGGGGGSLSSSSTSGEVSVSPPPPSTTPVSTCDWQVRKNLEKPHVLHRLDRLAQQSWVLEKTSLGKVPACGPKCSLRSS